MALSDLELLPPEDRPDKKQNNVVVNQTTNIGQFIQLVNQTTQLPDGATLSSYSAEDREWIKRRMETEQDSRHTLIATMAKNQHELNMTNAGQTHQHNNLRFYGGVFIFIVTLALTGLLIYLKAGWFALAPLVIIMSAPVSVSASAFINEKIKALTKPPDKE